MVISTTRPRSSPLGSDPCISGAAACVGPMIKFPSLSAGGTSPSGNSFASTYPAVCGSRVGGVGLTYVCGAGAAVCAPNTALIPTASKAPAAADITRLIANSLASTVANDRPPRVATPPGTPPSARLRRDRSRTGYPTLGAKRQGGGIVRRVPHPRREATGWWYRSPGAPPSARSDGVAVSFAGCPTLGAKRQGGGIVRRVPHPRREATGWRYRSPGAPPSARSDRVAVSFVGCPTLGAKRQGGGIVRRVPHPRREATGWRYRSSGAPPSARSGRVAVSFVGCPTL